LAGRASLPDLQLVQRSPKKLRIHPILAGKNIERSLARISAVAGISNPSSLDPIWITQENLVLKGVVELDRAIKANLETVSCVELVLDEERQIRWILDHHRKTKDYEDFVRIEIALDLKPFILQRAKENKRLGGRFKGSAKLPEAERIDTRAEIAKAADVAPRQVSRAEGLLRDAKPELLEALRSGEIKINRACTWLKENPKNQLDRLSEFRVFREHAKTIAGLMRKHRAKPHPPERNLDSRQIGAALAAADPASHLQIMVLPRTIQGSYLLLSEDLMQSIQTQGVLNL
jgi:hypothetical protein